MEGFSTTMVHHRRRRKAVTRTNTESRKLERVISITVMTIMTILMLTGRRASAWTTIGTPSSRSAFTGTTQLYGLGSTVKAKARQKVVSLKKRLGRISTCLPWNISDVRGTTLTSSRMATTATNTTEMETSDLALLEEKDQRELDSGAAASRAAMTVASWEKQFADMPENVQAQENNDELTHVVTTKSPSTATTAALSSLPTTAMPCHKTPFVELPSWTEQPGYTMTAIEREFRDKIAHFQQYSHRDVALLASLRMRVVLEGMAASTKCPQVYRAFEILYQDILPLRITGRFIFDRLSQVVQDCVAARSAEVDQVLQQLSTTVTREQVETAQLVFVWLIESAREHARNSTGTTTTTHKAAASAAAVGEHELVLSTDELCDSGMAETLVEWLSLDGGVPQLVSILDPEQQGHVNFCHFVIGLQACMRTSTEPQRDLPHPLGLVHQLLETFHPATIADWGHRPTTRVLDPEHERYNARYNFMLDTFASWKDLVPDGNGRRLDVLRGCFVGAENVVVREALRVVYVDHTAMRMAGNTIFALMTALMPRHRRPPKQHP